MSEPLSTHLPETAGGIAAVTGELIIETGLRKVRTVTATLGAVPTATEALVACTLEPVQPGGKRKAKLMVYAADGITPGVAETPVHWHAIGD